MVDALGKGVGVELTYKGQGHGAYGSKNKCVQAAVNGYLLTGKPCGRRDRLLLTSAAPDAPSESSDTTWHPPRISRKTRRSKGYPQARTGRP